MYRTLDELLTEDVDWMTEYEGIYYVKLAIDRGGDAVRQVNKRTKKVLDLYMPYPSYFAIEDAGAKPIDPATLRKEPFITKGTSKENVASYKTLNDLLKEKVNWMSEYEGFYYVRLAIDRGNDRVWKIDKKSGKVSYMQYIPYFTIEDKVTPINPSTLRRRA